MSKFGFILLLLGLFTRFSFGVKGSSCGTNRWQCADGSCIFLIGRCDNFPDCPDESDERGCVSVSCNEGQRPCSSGECIYANKFCDGVIHCKDAGDELAADCRGIIQTTTPTLKAEISTMVSESKTTAPSVNTTVLSWEPSPDKPTSLLAITVTSSPINQVTSQSWGQQFTIKSVDKPTTLSASPPPQIIVQGVIQTKEEIPKWPTWFHRNTPKFRHWTPERTSRGTTTMRPTTSYLYNWYNTAFLTTTSRIPCVEVEDRFEFCRRLYRGYYLHPTDCKQYIVCEWGYMHICTCPNGTHWDKQLRTCVWDYASPCITGKYDKPVIPDQTTMAVTSSVTTTSKSPSASTITNKFATTTPAIVPPPLRLRALPATPSWLKELSEKTFLKPQDPQPPKYQSLLTRFFKAIPQDGNSQGIRLNR